MVNFFLYHETKNVTCTIFFEMLRSFSYKTIRFEREKNLIQYLCNNQNRGYFQRQLIRYRVPRDQPTRCKLWNSNLVGIIKTDEPGIYMILLMLDPNLLPRYISSRIAVQTLCSLVAASDTASTTTTSFLLLKCPWAMRSNRKRQALRQTTDLTNFSSLRTEGM